MFDTPSIPGGTHRCEPEPEHHHHRRPWTIVREWVFGPGRVEEIVPPPGPDDVFR